MEAGREASDGGRDLRLLVAAVGLSALGDHAALTALLVLVHDRTGSPAAVAALLLGLWGPVVALGGVAGAVVDRVEGVRLLVLGSLGQAAVVLAMAAVAGPAAAILLAPALGVGIAIVQPAEFALIPAAARGRALARAGGRVETARHLGMTAGPLVGGGLAAAGLVTGALLLDAATFLVVALAASRMRARRPPRAGERPRARDGVLALARDRVLRTTLAAAAAALLVVSATIVALVAFATEVLGAGGVGYGALLAVWTAGMVAGAAGLAGRVPARTHATVALAAVAAQGAGILGGAAAATTWAVVLGHLLGGAAQGVKNVLLRALIHERVPPGMHGRAYAAWNAARNGAELAALLAGAALVAALGPRGTLMLAGGGSAAIALVALAALRARTPRTRSARAAATSSRPAGG